MLIFSRKICVKCKLSIDIAEAVVVVVVVIVAVEHHTVHSTRFIPRTATIVELQAVCETIINNIAYCHRRRRFRGPAKLVGRVINPLFTPNNRTPPQKRDAPPPLSRHALFRNCRRASQSVSPPPPAAQTYKRAETAFPPKEPPKCLQCNKTEHK